MEQLELSLVCSIGDTASFLYERYDQRIRNTVGKGIITMIDVSGDYRAHIAKRSSKKYRKQGYLDCPIFSVIPNARVVLTEKILYRFKEYRFDV